MFLILDSREKLGNLICAVAEVKQRSAMNPFLWLVGLCSSVCIVLLLSPDTPVWAKIFSMVIFGIIVLGVFGVAVFFAVTSPDKLRSEGYQIKHDVLNYCERSQTSPEKIVDALSTNPHLGDK